jgi:hypothetical protein
MKVLSLDAIADGALLDGLTPAEASVLLSQLAATQTRLAGRLLELVQLDDYRGDHDRLLDAKKAAEWLGVARSWLYRHAGQLLFTTRMGAHLRFSERGFERFIQNRTGPCETRAQQRSMKRVDRKRVRPATIRAQRRGVGVWKRLIKILSPSMT